jgi:hypothetical protein
LAKSPKQHQTSCLIKHHSPNSKADADRRSTAAASTAPSATMELPGRCRNFLVNVWTGWRRFLLSPSVNRSRFVLNHFFMPVLNLFFMPVLNLFFMPRSLGRLPALFLSDTGVAISDLARRTVQRAHSPLLTAKFGDKTIGDRGLMVSVSAPGKVTVYSCLGSGA